MPFQPGESGNPNGTTKLRRFYQTLDRVIAQDELQQAPKLRKACETLLSEAAKGEAWAIGMLADRLDGKPAQQINHAGHDGEALQIIFTQSDAEA